jgi:hypothetical protein
VPLVAEEKAFDAELSRHRPGRHAVCLDAFKRVEQPGEVAIRLRLTPVPARAAINFIEAPGCSLLKSAAPSGRPLD